MDQAILDKKTEKFREDLLDGSFKKEVSPNGGTTYSGKLEDRDHKALLGYVNSELFKKINDLEQEYTTNVK